MTRGEGGWLFLPPAGLSPAILRQFAWRTPAGPRQRRAHRPPTRPRPASADRRDVACRRTRRPRAPRPSAAARVGGQPPNNDFEARPVPAARRRTGERPLCTALGRPRTRRQGRRRCAPVRLPPVSHRGIATVATVEATRVNTPSVHATPLRRRNFLASSPLSARVYWRITR